MAETTETNLENTSIRAACITGGVGTGKTRRLIMRVIDLLQDGARPEDILVLCASPQAAQVFKRRLAIGAKDLGAQGADRVEVSCARDVALEVLGTDEAIAWSGREPRVMCTYEERFLMEDMKVCGGKPKRLREMLKFFYRSWTELADDDPEWLIYDQETEVHTLLKDNLALRRAYLEPEVCNCAVNYLRSHEEARGEFGRPHVLLDDANRQSRASQQLAEILATRSIAMAGDRVASVPDYDSYAYAEGIDEFLEAHPGAEEEQLTVCRRGHVATHCGRALLSDDSMPTVAYEASPTAPIGELKQLSTKTPEEEFDEVADLVADELEAGTPAEQIAVMVPNDIWGRNITTALRRRGVLAQQVPEKQPVRGDVRELSRCEPARILCALELVADPESALAWRDWCGFGDHLTNSAAFAGLRELCEERGCGLVEALELLAREEAGEDEGIGHLVGGPRVVEAYQAGLALIEHAEGLQGEALLEQLARKVCGDDDAEVPAVILRLCLDEEGDDDAAAMTARARERQLSPIVSEGAVPVLPYDHNAGISPKLLVVTGFVNGFIPCDAYFDAAQMNIEKQEREHAKDTARVYELTGKADETLVLSYFTSTDLQTASNLDLKIERIKLVDGVRTCVIAPSEFVKLILH